MSSGASGNKNKRFNLTRKSTTHPETACTRVIQSRVMLSLYITSPYDYTLLIYNSRSPSHSVVQRLGHLMVGLNRAGCADGPCVYNCACKCIYGACDVRSRLLCAEQRTRTSRSAAVVMPCKLIGNLLLCARFFLFESHSCEHADRGVNVVSDSGRENIMYI